MEKIKRIDKNFKTMAIKGKQYVEVKERIKYLAFDFDGDYSIKTKFWHFPESRTWVVKATLKLKQNGLKEIYTGHAQEVESDSYKDVNHTSALENCETSAIGRACAMAGIGVDISIASADEVNKAINRGEQNKPAQGMQPAKPMQDMPKQEKAPQAAPNAPVIIQAVKEMEAVTGRPDMAQVWNKYPALHTDKAFLAAMKKAGEKYPKQEVSHAS